MLFSTCKWYTRILYKTLNCKMWLACGIFSKFFCRFLQDSMWHGLVKSSKFLHYIHTKLQEFTQISSLLHLLLCRETFYQYYRIILIIVSLQTEEIYISRNQVKKIFKHLWCIAISFAGQVILTKLLFSTCKWYTRILYKTLNCKMWLAYGIFFKIFFSIFTRLYVTWTG